MSGVGCAFCLWLFLYFSIYSFEKMNTVQTPTVTAVLVEMFVTKRSWISLWKDEYSADPNIHETSCWNVGNKQTNSCWISLWKDEYSAHPNSQGKSCWNVADRQMNVEQVFERMNTVYTPTVMTSLVEILLTDIDKQILNKSLKGWIQCRPQQAWQVLLKCCWQADGCWISL